MRFLPVFGPHFALFPSMSCAYLYVHNFLPTNVSRSWGCGIRGRRENLAFDKETAEATRNSLSGRGLTAKDAKNAKGGWRNPASSAKTEADYAGAGGEKARPSPQPAPAEPKAEPGRTRRSQREDSGNRETQKPEGGRQTAGGAGIVTFSRPACGALAFGGWRGGG